MMYFKCFKKYIPIALLGIFCMGFVAFLELNQIDYMGKIIDEGIANKDINIVLTNGFIMVIYAVVAAISGIIASVCAAYSSGGFAQNLRETVYSKVQGFSVKNVSRFQTASLVTRLTNDINYLQLTIMQTLRLGIRAPMLLVTSLMLIYKSSPAVSTYVLIPIALLAVCLSIILFKGYPLFSVVQKQLDKLNQKVQEGLINIRVIKSFVREDFEDGRFSNANEEFKEINVRAHSLMMLIHPTMMLCLNIATILLLYVCSSFVLINHTLAVGNVVVILNYVRFALFSLNMLSMIITMMSRSRASVERINEVMAVKESVTNALNLIEINEVLGKITFENVSFKYYDEQTLYTLNDLDFSINPGERFGIIGSTGSGKSTLINLIGRLIDPTQGSVKLDDIDIKDIDIHQLRAHLGFVPQKNVLFSGTIRENLKLGNALASDEEMKEAARIANIDAFIESLPEGYDSLVSQGGTNFSGGQKQRLCLARALIIKPRILIMDDSTSALDADTESRIMNALENELPEMTVISIAQKVSSVASCNRIMVINDGIISAIDNHQNLLNTNEIYQEIYNSQLQKGAA